jgi:glutathione S-transferase
MKVMLYGFRISPFVEKVIRGIQYKGLDWQIQAPTGPAGMKKWSPLTGKMPAADIAGERLFDSTFILRRLDELAPTPPLVSPDPTIAAQQRHMEDWSDESLYWNVMAFRWSATNGRASAERVLDAIAAPAVLRPLISPLMRRTVRRQVAAQGAGRLPQSMLAREFAGRLDDLVPLLADRAFFFSDSPSVADLALFGQLTFADVDASPETRDEVRKRPGLVQYMQRVAQATRGPGSAATRA